MARMAGVPFRPLGPNTEARLAKKNKVIIHTMVGTLAGTENYFRTGNGAGYTGTESHFGTAGDGTIWQWQDTEYEADAQSGGNDDAISIENADKGSPFPAWSGSNVPAFTLPQIEANARILAWANKVHGIPLVLIPNTLDTTRGVGYHRQGIEPYKGAGETYSSSFGKVCPGDRRVAQIPIIIARARVLAGQGGGVPTEEDDLPYTPDQLAQYGANGDVIAVRDSSQFRDAMQDLVWSDTTVTRKKADGTSYQVKAIQELADAKSYAMATATAVAALTATVNALATGGDVTSEDLQKIKDAAAAGAQAAIQDVQLRLDAQLVKITALTSLVEELGEAAGLDAQELADELARRLSA